MGLLDILKKIFRREEVQTSKSQPELPKYEPRHELICGYHDEKGNHLKGYDSTRAIIDKNPEEINGEKLYNITVSWYMSDESYFKAENPEVPEHVMASINIERMRNDKTYYNYVMKNLFSKNRVMEFKRKSMMTEAELEKERHETGNLKTVPCGRYIGRVVDTSGANLEIKFDEEIGRYMHNKQDIVEEREKYRKERLAEKHKEEQLKSEKRENHENDIREEDEVEK